MVRQREKPIIWCIWFVSFVWLKQTNSIRNTDEHVQQSLYDFTVERSGTDRPCK